MRDEEKILACGCKIGRSKGGVWFYDYLCEIHVGEVYDEQQHYSPEKAEALTKKLNEEMKKLEKAEKLKNKALEELSETERKAYEFIRKAEQPLAIRDMPHQLQGPVGKLRSKGLVEVYRQRTKVSKHGFVSMKMTNCVRVR